MKYKILNAEAFDYSPQAKEILESFADVDYFNGLSETEIAKRISRYQGLIVRLKNYIGPQIIKRTNNLLFIASATTGLNHIDVDTCKKRSIKIISLFGESKFLNKINATAEHTMALILSLIRNIPFAFFNVRKGHWRRDRFRGTELEGKTLGVIGMGRLGKKVSRYARAFGMKVIAYDPYLKEKPAGVEFSDMQQLLSACDIVTLHIPFNERTRKLFNRNCFNLMKRGAIFINTSRGEVVDEGALLEALAKRKILAAALDVLSEEQDSRKMESHPLISYAKNNSNLIITPHIGGATWESMKKTEIFIARKIKKFLARLGYGKR